MRISIRTKLCECLKVDWSTVEAKKRQKRCFFLLNYSYKVRATDCLCDEEKIKTRKPIRISLSSARRILTTISRCFSHSDTHKQQKRCENPSTDRREAEKYPTRPPPLPKKPEFQNICIIRKAKLRFQFIVITQRDLKSICKHCLRLCYCQYLNSDDEIRC